MESAFILKALAQVPYIPFEAVFQRHMLENTAFLVAITLGQRQRTIPGSHHGQ